MKRILLSILVFATYSNIFGQSADITRGCAPMTVNFSADNALSTYFWDFGNGSSSTLENPQVQYVNSGDFTVSLYEGEGGTLVGQLTIEVIPLPDIKIEASINEGCAPQTIQFTNNSVVDPRIEVLGFQWAFGDGASSNDENPLYTYTLAGDFDVTLRILTGDQDCESTLTFEDFISLSERVNVNFDYDQDINLCELPLTLPIANSSENNPSFSYTWDFGNGETSNEYNPTNPTYDEAGEYTIILTVDNGDGCEVNIQRKVNVGPPQFDLMVSDTICPERYLSIVNNTVAENFEWKFDGTATIAESTQRTPFIQYLSGGDKEIQLTALNGEDCKSDTLIKVYVDEPNADFTFDPLISCQDPQIYSFEAVDKTHDIYLWNDIQDNVGELYDYLLEYDDPDRDSFYVFEPDTFYMELTVYSEHGCKGEKIDSFYWDHPDAEFTPSTSRGCAPLTVNISDESVSIYNITSYTYDWGDGTSDTYTPGQVNDISHVYDTPGEYYVKSTIVTDVGCIDESAGIWIFVGEKLDASYVLPQNEFCLYDELTLNADNLDDRIDSWHFDIDGSVNHCAEDPNYTHKFIDRPGTFNVTLNVEYNGCYNTTSEVINVNGSKANIKYMTNCEDHYTVMFTDSSFNATKVTWIIEGDTLENQDDIFEYTFPESGDYNVILESVNENDSCSPDRDSVTVFVRKPVADFLIDTIVCDTKEYFLDASISKDVDERCHQGYLWHVPNWPRPREKGTPILDVAFGRGWNQVTLITEDINGCTDTLSKDIFAYGMDPNFAFDKDKICFPNDVQFTDLSIADTTVVGYQWSFGSNQQNPLKNFTESDNPFNLDQLPIQLKLTDALGCEDSISLFLEIYEPFTNLFLSPRQFCVGSEVNFAATDYTLAGSFLHFDWEIENIGNSEDQAFGLVIDQPGVHNVTLNIEEDASGCTNTIDTSIVAIQYPMAEITGLEDTVCYQTILDWTGINSTIDPNENPNQTIYEWKLNGLPFVNSPAITQGVNEKGVHEIELIVRSQTGCADTTSANFVAIGPEGNLSADKTKVCRGEDITFTITDMVEVDSIIWNGGQGTISNQQPPYVFSYDQIPESGMTTMNVSLFSEEGCQIVYELPIEIYNLDASFDYIIDTLECPGAVTFVNNSLNATNYLWDFGDGNDSNLENPDHQYAGSGQYNVKLTVSDDVSNCSVDTIKTIDIGARTMATLPNLFSPNNDMHQDVFDIVILDLDGNAVSNQEEQRSYFEINTFQIFNRWGKKVYDNQNNTTGWNGFVDGDMGGEQASEDVYFYYINFNYKCQEAMELKGNVTLIR